MALGAAAGANDRRYVVAWEAGARFPFTCDGGCIDGAAETATLACMGRDFHDRSIPFGTSHDARTRGPRTYVKCRMVRARTFPQP